MSEDKNNIEKKVGSNMVDSLMPAKTKKAKEDADKAAAEALRRQQSYNRGYGSYSGAGGSGAYSQRDMFSPVDEDFDTFNRSYSPSRRTRVDSRVLTTNEKLAQIRTRLNGRIVMGEMVLDDAELTEIVQLMADEVLRMFDAAGFVMPHPVGGRNEIAREFAEIIVNGCHFQDGGTRELANVYLNAYDVDPDTGEIIEDDLPEGF